MIFQKLTRDVLKAKRKKPKEVYQYANEQDPRRRLYTLYNSKCPEDRPPNALLHMQYLTSLPKPKGKVWYLNVPMGHNTLAKIISEMMKEAGFQGHYTNHSLRVTSTT